MLTLLLAAWVTVTGTVRHEGDALPGVTVTLTRGTTARTAVTNEHGRYSFSGVEAGSCELRYELDGFRTKEQRVRAGDDVPPVQLEPTLRSVIAGCGVSACSPEPAATPWDLPLCSEQEQNRIAIEAAANGDRSALELLRTRYAQTVSLQERDVIAAVLLDDAPVRDELLARAAVCVRFPNGEAPEYLAWCAERQLPAEDHWWSSYSGLATIAAHRSARALLLEALDTDSPQLVEIAVTGLAYQRHQAAIPAIRRALRRFSEDDADSLAFALIGFGSRAADAVAHEHLDERRRAEYDELRALLREQP